MNKPKNVVEEAFAIPKFLSLEEMESSARDYERQAAEARIVVARCEGAAMAVRHLLQVSYPPLVEVPAEIPPEEAPQP